MHPDPYQQPGQVPGFQQPRVVKSVQKKRGLSAKSHMFHLVMTLCTFGVWGILVWFPLWVYRLFVRRKVVTRHYYE